MDNTLTSARRYDLDWLRFFAIVLLLFFHTGMWFTTWDWHVKNSELSTTFNYWMVWSHYWRMPLLLFISGAGTYLALGKRTFGQFAGERFKRLFVPLVFGMFVVVSPQIYYEHIAKYPDYMTFYKTVFEFKPYPEGSFSWHHLWFIVYLFLYSLLMIPLLRYVRSAKSESFKEKLFKVMSNPWGALFVPSIFIFLTQLALRPYFPEETHDLKDLGFMVFYLSFFFFGILFYSEQKLWNSLGGNRLKILLAAGLILIPVYTVYMHFRGVYVLPFEERTLEIMFEVPATFMSWFTVITIIAFGQHYLNRPHPWLSKINESLYPFYILHQTVIIAIGYYICQLDWSVTAKFWSISFLTLASCLAMYFLLIKPFNMMRFLFGMKPKKDNKITPSLEA